MGGAKSIYYFRTHNRYSMIVNTDFSLEAVPDRQLRRAGIGHPVGLLRGISAILAHQIRKNKIQKFFVVVNDCLDALGMMPPKIERLLRLCAIVCSSSED